MEGTAQTEAITQQLSELQTLFDQLRREVSEQVHEHVKQTLPSPVQPRGQPAPAPTVSRRVRNLDDKLLECELRDAREGLCFPPLCASFLQGGCCVHIQRSPVACLCTRKREAQEEAQGDGTAEAPQPASLVFGGRARGVHLCCCGVACHQEGPCSPVTFLFRTLCVNEAF